MDLCSQYSCNPGFYWNRKLLDNLRLWEKIRDETKSITFKMCQSADLSCFKFLSVSMKCKLNRPSCWITPQELKWWHSERYSCAFPCKHTNFFVSQLRLWAGWASEGKLGFTPGLSTHGGVTCPPNIQPEVEVALSTSEQTKLLRSDCSSHTGRCVYWGN